MTCLQLLDLNGNKFGVDGKLEILKILEPFGEAISSLSEDEGSDEEEEAESEDQGEEDSGDEEAENSEVVVDDADGQEDYDEVEDYEEYDDEDEDYDEEEDGQEYDEEEEGEDQQNENKFGSANLFQQQQQSNLFKPFNNQIQMNLGQMNLNDKQKPNLFSAMVANSYLKTNTISTFDNFINNANLENLKLINDENTLKNIKEVSKQK
jgi:hypothetical protein